MLSSNNIDGIFSLGLRATGPEPSQLDVLGCVMETVTLKFNSLADKLPERLEPL